MQRRERAIDNLSVRTAQPDKKIATHTKGTIPTHRKKEEMGKTVDDEKIVRSFGQ